MVGLKRSGKSPMSACRNEGGSSRSVLTSLMLAAIRMRRTLAASWLLGRAERHWRSAKLVVLLQAAVSAPVFEKRLTDLGVMHQRGNVAAAVRQCFIRGKKIGKDTAAVMRLCGITPAETGAAS